MVKYNSRNLSSKFVVFDYIRADKSQQKNFAENL